MPYRTYLRAVNEKFGFLATWLPGQDISLGDVGTLEKGVFRRQDSLSKLGYDLEQVASDVPVDFDHSSGNSIDFTMGARGSGSGAAAMEIGSAEARIQFSETGGFVLRATRCIEHSLVSRSQLRKAVSDARAKGVWQDSWLVIDRIYVAGGLTVMVCNSSSGYLNLAATVKIQAGPFDIANADLGLKASAWSGDITRVVGAQGIAPMFSAARLRTGFFRGDRIESTDLKLRSKTPNPGDLVPVTLQDALDED